MQTGQRTSHVLTAQEAGRKGHPDQNHFALAKKLGRVLITCDRDYLNERHFPLISSPPVVVLGIGRGTMSEIIGALQSLVYIANYPQFFDKWCKIYAKPGDKNQGEWTEYLRFQDGSTQRQRYRWQARRIQIWREL